MSDKKNIDRIFQEGLKDFEVSPKPRVWKNIEKQISKKEKNKKIIPLWLRLTGTAAVLLLLISIGNQMYNSKNATVVNTNYNNEGINNTTQKNLIHTKPKQPSKFNTTVTTENVDNTKYNTSYTQRNKSKNNTLSNNNSTSIASASFVNFGVNANSNPYYNNRDNASTTQNNSKLKTTFPEINEKNSISKLPLNTNVPVVTKQDSILSEEKTNNNQTIEEAIAEAKEKTIQEQKTNRWQVAANIAPVYYNTLGKGSPIDSQFNDNPKTGEINTSYGVQVSYAVNPKLKIRSGLNRLKLSYDTDNVIVYDNVIGASATLKNVNANGSNISAISQNNLLIQEQNTSVLPDANAALSQRLSYYEVPVELEYAIVNKKFGVSVIGGVSTFILNDNQIYSEYENRKRYIGEANNINNVSFSGNLGLGLNYKFSEKVLFNLQPTFKYQINAYSNTSGNFSPYIIGVYTGLSYKF